MATLITWDINPAGMLVVGYDTNGNGKADFYTLRRVLVSFPSERGIADVAQNFPDCPVFVSGGESSEAFYYIVAKYPLFYAIDLDGDGVWDLVYKDVAEDGVNGNEVFYDSPSGMFTSDIVNY